MTAAQLSTGMSHGGGNIFGSASRFFYFLGISNVISNVITEGHDTKIPIIPFQTQKTKFGC